jgi:hypothetical protein
MTEVNKMVVRRLVEEVFSGGHLEVIDERMRPRSPRRPSGGSRRSGPASPMSRWRS